MSVLDAFYSTWSRARETFGEGVPQDGAQLDAGTSQLRQMQAGVEAAAPDSRWQGPASEAYAAKNKQHAAAYEKLAGLDKRMAAEITNAANVVTMGRQNLDEVKSWVTSAAASIPASTSAEDRDRKLLPIANKGIGQISEIIQQSTGQMQDISNRIQGVKSEYAALGNKKLGPEFDKLGDDKDRSNYVGEEGDEGEKTDGELKPEDMEQLVHEALGGDAHAASEVDRILNTIDENQMGPNSVSHPLSPLQAELVGQMQAQMKKMSMSEINDLREKLGPNKKILANAMQVMSDPDVSYPRHDKDGPQVVTPGAIPNYGVLPGDTGALPDSVQEILNQRTDWSGPPDPTKVVPDSPGSALDMEAFMRDRAGDKITNLADIIGEGDQRFQQGSQLDREMMADAKEWLSREERTPWDKHWGDGVVERVFETAGRDSVVDHDMFTQDKNFIGDVLTHEWKDGGESARTLTDWIGQTAESDDPVVNQRAGETAHALANYIGEHPELKDIGEKKLSLGVVNPQLTESLANAVSPYIDDMVGNRIDNTSGFAPLDNPDVDSAMHKTTNLFSVLDTNDNASDILNGRAAAVHNSWVNSFAESAINDPAHSTSSLLSDAGHLKAIVQEGALNAANDKIIDSDLAKQEAHRRLELAWDLGIGVTGSLPEVGGPLALEGTILKEAFVGPDPENSTLAQADRHTSIDLRAALAQEFINHGMGDQINKDFLQARFNEDTGKWEINAPARDASISDDDYYKSALYSNFFSGIDPALVSALDNYDAGYNAVLDGNEDWKH